MPKLSIIVPVYNVEKYIRKCIDFILGKTFKDFELILVDDGSPDNCGEICESYARNDNRIRVIHRANGGLSAARNTGLSYATGKYIGFVDSDDYVSPVMYEKLINSIEKHNADICKCGYNEFDDLGIRRKLVYPDTKVLRNNSRHNALLPLYFDNVLYVVVWNAI